MTWFLMRYTITFTCVIILLFDTVRITALNINAIQLKAIETTLTRIVEDLSDENSALIGCNFIHHAIIHVRSSRALTGDDLAEYEYSFHDWSKKMLIFVSLSSRLRSMTEPMWAFCMYTYKMQNGQSVESVYEETFEILRGTLEQKCPVLEHPKNSPLNYDDYMARVTDENRSSSLRYNVDDSDILFKDETIRELTGLIADNISMDRLHLSNDVLDILIDEFGLIPSNGLYKRTFIWDYKTISDPETTLHDQFKRLHDAHCCLVSVLKTMMVRLCLYHLELIKYVVCGSRRFRYNSKMFVKLKQFIRFLWLPNDDPLTRFSELYDFKTDTVNTEIIETLQTKGIQVLEDVCDLLRLKEDCRKFKSMQLSTFKIKDIAERAGFGMKTASASGTNVLICHGIEITNLYADVFVDYLEKTFPGSEFYFVKLFAPVF